jgi:Raf kinase inhibitor-like YbhB/YbcL family protein
MYDPDAPSGKFIHWVVYDIPLNTIGIKENFPKRPLVDGIKQGKNDFGRIGYGGPCPPFGEKHRYFIVIYAVDLPSLNLSPGARPEDVFFKIRNHIVGKGEYMGVYKRK